LENNETFGIDKVRFGQLEGSSGGKIDQKLIADIPVEATVELGKTKLALREVLELTEGSIISLDRNAGDVLDLKVGGQTVAQGEVIAVDDYYGIRITKVTLK
jgi:flagellar motor switch protein FliN/FliY